MCVSRREGRRMPTKYVAVMVEDAYPSGLPDDASVIQLDGEMEHGRWLIEGGDGLRLSLTAYRSSAAEMDDEP